MSAPNFSVRHNSRHINVFCISEDFEAYKKDLKKEDPDNYEENADYYENSPYAMTDWAEEEQCYYLEWLEEKLNEKFSRGVNFIDVRNTRIVDGLEVCTVARSFQFAGIDFDVQISIDLESGYYEGFALDWNLKNVADFDYMPDLEDCATLLRDERWTGSRYACFGLNAGLSKILAPRLQKRIEKELKALTDIVDDCLEAVAPHVWEGSVLSNGEGIYFEQEKKAA